jgi:hypothetical protein
MTLTIKAEFVGEILEILRGDIRLVFDTNTVDPSEYQYYYDTGFDWAFDIA